MEKRPYIGITGFCKQQEVFSALQVFPRNSNRQLMVGVIVTYKSLRVIPIKPEWEKQIPRPSVIAHLFVDDERVVNLAHYSTEESLESSMLADMIRIHNLAGPNFHGFQLNISWPSVNQLDDYRRTMGWDSRIVLQIGKKAVEEAGGTTQGVVERLYDYISVIDDILFDLSGGLGKPLNTKLYCKFLSAIAEKKWDIGLGAAGGIGPNSLSFVKPLIDQFSNLSIDSQRWLRDEENNLDPRSVEDYLTKAPRLFV